MKTEFPLFGKRILFIGIGFYDYDQAIKTKLEELGGIVSYICSVQYTIFYRVLSSVGLRKAAKKYANKKRRQLIISTPSNHDYIFIIKGEGLTQIDINLIKSQNPNAKSILYFWDDLKRIDNHAVLINNFQNIWSFDPEDCQKYGFKFRPLFYRDDIKVNPEKKYFLSSIGWCHSNRLEVFRSIANKLKRENKTYFLKLYVGKKTYIINRYIRRLYNSTDNELLITTPIKYFDAMHVISGSIFVLDIPHPSQKGLSIRTIEALKSGCHIITTNKYIKEHPYISSSYYTILSKELSIESKFPIIENLKPSKMCEIFSLENFILELFNNL